jgi:FkbM family methyltransferase
MEILFRLKEKLLIQKSSDPKNNLPTILYKLAQLGLEVTHAIDVGAHKGDWSRGLLKFFPECKLILIEPQTRFQELLDLKNSNPNIHLFACGAGPSDGTLKFRHHERSDSSSFVLNPQISFAYEEVLNIHRIDTLVLKSWGQNVFPQVLKIDAEGFDLEILDGAKHVLPKVEILIVEAGLTNQYFNNNLLESLRKLDYLGFDVIDVSSTVNNPNTGLIWNCDITLVNRSFTKYGHLFQWE